MINREFFQDVELTKAENAVLVWLCGWDEWTINAIVSVLRKAEGKSMAIYRIKVIQRGTIIVDGVDSLEDAEEYIESCNPVDEIKCSGFLETMQGGIELQKISILDSMMIKEFADKIDIRQAEIIKWLFLHGKVADSKSEICFDDMKEFADQYGFVCEKEG